LQPKSDDDFTIRNLQEVFQAQETSSRVMSILLAAIASVFSDRRRYRHHEHHAGFSDRATREIGFGQAIGPKLRTFLRNSWWKP